MSISFSTKANGASRIFSHVHNMSRRNINTNWLTRPFLVRIFEHMQAKFLQAELEDMYIKGKEKLFKVEYY